MGNHGCSGGLPRVCSGGLPRDCYCGQSWWCPLVAPVVYFDVLMLGVLSFFKEGVSVGVRKLSPRAIF